MSAPHAPNLARRLAVIAAGWVAIVWSIWVAGILTTGGRTEATRSWMTNDPVGRLHHGPVVHPAPHHHHHGGIALAARRDGTNS